MIPEAFRQVYTRFFVNCVSWEESMEIDLKNVGIIKEAHLSFKPGLNLIIGPSSSGKSTLLRAIRSMMDNTFADSNVAFGQKKMAIRIKDGENTATYVRDLENASKKSAYQVNGQVYTKVGRNSLDAISQLFKIAPVEIDGEKVNFNFSAQFSGPFLLLGSTSLLYSILTYRSTFDITKVNDLYFSDYKKVKQDITIAQKTKETLEVEENKLKKKYEMLSPITDIFNRMQVLKQDKSSYDSLVELSVRYKQLKSQIKSLINQREELNNILPKYDYLNVLNAKFTLISKYVSLRDDRSKYSIEDISFIPSSIEYLQLLFKKRDVLSRYALLKKAVFDYSKLSVELNNLPDLNSLELGNKYMNISRELNDKKNELDTCTKDYTNITEQINAVGICPLCKQPLNACKD